MSLKSNLEENRNMDEFHTKLNFYIREAASGVYHNPYDVENELNEILLKNKIHDEAVEDQIYSVSSLFWSM